MQVRQGIGKALVNPGAICWWHLWQIWVCVDAACGKVVVGWFRRTHSTRGANIHQAHDNSDTKNAAVMCGSTATLVFAPACRSCCMSTSMTMLHTNTPRHTCCKLHDVELCAQHAAVLAQRQRARHRHSRVLQRPQHTVLPVHCVC